MSNLYRGVSNGYAVLRQVLRSRRSSLTMRALALTSVGLALLATDALAASQPQADDTAVRVQRVVDRLRATFGIDNAVAVELVDSDPRVVSVRPLPGRRGAFLLSVQRSFLAALDADDIEAVVAHEMGHVWIYTHHPFLQTEQLANEIALRHVGQAQLERVYHKLWGAGAVSGDLASFLGLRRASADAPSSAPAAAPAGPRAAGSFR